MTIVRDRINNVERIDIKPNTLPAGGTITFSVIYFSGAYCSPRRVWTAGYALSMENANE